jgi:integrase
VFPTARGAFRTKDNARQRVVDPVFRRADELLRAHGYAPLPKGLTAHSLRHTYASAMVAYGDDPALVMAHVGHTTAKFTLEHYAKTMQRDPAARERLKALVDGGISGLFGTGDALGAALPGLPEPARDREGR